MCPSADTHKQTIPARRYQIREKIFSLGDNFKIKNEMGQDVYTVRSKFFSVEGLDIFAHSLTFTKDGRIVTIVSKTFFSSSDTYGVEIADDEDQAFILALAIVLDQI
ncbi:unnamed protein product [Rotaria sp. Silwood2]|nr:unnamed protein product [Rotaria sp. Silwood2]CAF2671442.1 unnamed protein product [Rotaria sp. Silwood2]CAF2931971.1 unnamed protein product [Rotaria sp. Silwood2]CAF3109898.1 unnamed protein product [Rotaria sp. Silwood2]CAF3875159.1 unnamed protein product [Rotaria sp. Silwood2]